MKCPYCGFLDDKVMDSRSFKDGEQIRRRRQCKQCKKRFTTYEKVENVPFMVIKKDGRREPFDRQKVLTGVLKACEKRPVPMAAIEALTDKVEAMVKDSQNKEVPTSEIGSLIMEELKNLDEVAYVRFASVYRQFKDISEFMEEIRGLLK